MVQAWKCDNCSYLTCDPTEAGDHERKYYGELIAPGVDADGKPLHFMDDLGE
jgi:hypothetical protein